MGKRNKTKSRQAQKKDDDFKPVATRKERRKKGKSSGHGVDDFKLRQAVESDGNRSILDMEADGNCLFRALSDQLYYDHGGMHEEVRSEVCDYLEGHEEEFSVFLVLDEEEEDEDAADFESYVNNMRQDGEWGGNLELVVASRLYRRKITVFSASLAAFTINPEGEKPAGPDMLLSYHDNRHYNSVRDKTLPRPPPPVKAMRNIIPSCENDSEMVNGYEVTDESVTNENAEPKPDSADTDAERETGPNGQEDELPPVNKNPKKNAPCPCGSGQRYKKCCFAKEKHAKRLQKMRGDNSMQSDSAESSSPEMDGGFRVLQI